MTTQSEQTLENELIEQLAGELKYEHVVIRDEADLLVNLKAQLEKHNNATYSDSEFTRILNHLSKGSVFDKAKTLRETFHFQRDNGESAYVQFFNQREWCQNQFQVTNQVTNEGSYKNRYDVTLLINGLPLVQIELKRRGLELKEAFNQTNRYQRHSYDAGSGLFQYVQLFVISNGVNTKYYANNRNQSFKFTSFWTDKENVKINKLSDFAEAFLERCHIAKMIARYTVLEESNKIIKVLRPYQYYASEAIVERVKNSTKNGYIWHTTGSGKTLTSFKASQILIGLPDVYKVVFAVDRNDLDTQTIREFNAFKKDSVDTTTDTRTLVKQFEDPDTKLIVTTIQKLNTAITREKHTKRMDELRDKRIVFIFDECHRSQFGDTHKRITEYFTNHQLFGFTGTPIFAENAGNNAHGRRTTEQLFGECLHKYVITDAISDENVLKFSVEYYKGFRLKDGSLDTDLDVEAINIKEALEAPQRLEQITDFILANHDRKTHSRDYTAMFAVSSVDVLTKYYELFKAKQADSERKLRIATIFSYGANEDDKAADDMLDEDAQLDIFSKINEHSRDRLEGYISDYNREFGTNYTTRDSKSFYAYYRDIATRVRNREIDILLVVNMFLTGFDSPTLNTLYVDKNLRYHGLLQAYSRTNRIHGEAKSQGNIVVFRNLKKATDDAVALFSNKEASGIIFREPYETYVAKFNEALAALQQLTPSPETVDDLFGENQEAEFVQKFRELLRLRNILVSFTEFTFDDTQINEQVFLDYTSKYLDLYRKTQRDHEKEKVSILDDIDFELELVRTDKINVDYIIKLLTKLVGAQDEERKSQIVGNILDTVTADPLLHSKRELIEKFISQNIPNITDSAAVESEFNDFWQEEEQAALRDFAESENVDLAKLQKVIDHYLFTGQQPRTDVLANTLKFQPSIIKRKSVLNRLTAKLKNFIETFIEGI